MHYIYFSPFILRETLHMCVIISAHHCHTALSVLIHPFWSFSQPCCLSMSLSAPPVPHYYCFTTVPIFHCTNGTQTKIQYKNSAVTEKYSDAHLCLSPTMKSSSSSWNAIEYFLLDSVFSSL